MKRVLCLILSMSLICTIIFVPINSDAFSTGTYEKLTYTKYDDHIEITGCEKSAVSIDIPAKIDGLPVTSINALEFILYRSSLTNINIPDSVTSIAYGAFYSCDSLLNITVAAGNQNYCDIDGVLFNKYKTEVHTFPQGKIQSEYTIPDM